MTAAVAAGTAPAEGIDTRRWSPHPGVGFGVAAVAHFLAARLAGRWTLDPDAAQPFWLATGVTVAIAMASPHALRPLVVLGGALGQAADTWWFIDSDPRAVFGDVIVSTVAMGVGVAVFGWWFGNSGRMGRSHGLVEIG